MNSRSEEFAKAGIDLYLTAKGRDLLAKIIADGCPVKTNNGDFVHIKCPYNIATTTSLNCEVCWKKWLKSFEEA